MKLYSVMLPYDHLTLVGLAAIFTQVRDLRKYAYYNREAIRKIAKKSRKTSNVIRLLRYDKRCGKSKTVQAELMEKLHGSPMAHAEQRCEVLLKSLQEDCQNFLTPWILIPILILYLTFTMTHEKWTTLCIPDAAVRVYNDCILTAE